MFTHLIIFSAFNFVRGNQLEGDHIGEGDGTNKYFAAIFYYIYIIIYVYSWYRCLTGFETRINNIMSVYF